MLNACLCSLPPKMQECPSLEVLRLPVAREAVAREGTPRLQEPLGVCRGDQQSARLAHSCPGKFQMDGRALGGPAAICDPNRCHTACISRWTDSQPTVSEAAQSTSSQLGIRNHWPISEFLLCQAQGEGPRAGPCLLWASVSSSEN